MQFDEIYKLVHDFTDIELKISDLDTQKKTSKQKQELINLEKQLENIRFKLELPYKFLELITKARAEYITVETKFISDTIELVLKDYDKYKADCYLHLDTCTYDDLNDAMWFIQSIKDRREESKRLAKLKEAALSKLTKEEKEVLGLN